ncbi:S-layer homology domain-containing protein [Agathobaculum sp. Marseille-P7918]|uniref:S-layer homology domain-containing protein n=1 Tax=Agathobaculum sp. Marseille-P7918 TaxID=2479843 RepID=UPI0013DE070E|nr:S-layer homology domain-containing protein [Agathobaculum sp. Marseille-P7918]
MKKHITAASLAALMAVSALPVAACAAPVLKDGAPVPQLNTTDHMQYMNGYEDGTFRPDATITRAEACQLIASLLTEQVKNEDRLFTDVDVSAWYAEAVRQMTGFGLVNGYADGTFLPNASITRAEFVTILSRFPHEEVDSDMLFIDVPETHWAFDAVHTALAQGWVTGDPSGLFRPNDSITRAEAVTILNRVLGRQGDAVMAATGEGIRVMPDVPDTHWAYLAMLEATTDHKYEMTDGIESWTSYDKETTTLAEGWHNIGGLLFHVNADRQFDRNTTVDGLELDRNGRYTTGSEQLDKLLTSAVAGVVNDKMTQLEKLRAVYDYAKKTFGYLGIGTVDTSKDGWQIEQAINMLTNKRGNCYSWSSVFTYLARQVGFDAKAVVGTGVSPKGSESVHAWTEITIDGVAYTFDPQIESVYAARYGEHYDLFMKPYGEAEWGYKKAEEPEQPDTPEAPEADASLVALMDKIYGDKKDIMVAQTVLYNGMGSETERGLDWYLGTTDVQFDAGLASEAMITSQAHSIVLLRMPQGADMEAAKAKIAESIDPFKWICVGVNPDKVRVESNGDLICVVMDEENGDYYADNFLSFAVAE